MTREARVTVTLAHVTYVRALQEWFLRQLESDLRRKHPELAAAFEAAPPRSDAELSQWAERLEFPPLEPWTTLINAAVSIELGLEELAVVLDSLREARDGKAAWFFTAVSFVEFTSCLERLEFLVKRMGRGN